jgi:two-component system nitrogen regulation response regulator NtrX
MVPEDEITDEDLQRYLRPDDPMRQQSPGQQATLRDARENFERDYIISALKKNNGNVSLTARELDIERTNLHRKIRQYGIDADR